MEKVSERWIATVDARRARMFRCHPTRQHAWRLEEAEVALRNPWEQAHERGRPNYMPKGPQAGPHHAATEGRQEEEGQRRFAKDVAGWLDAHLKNVSQVPVVCFGPAKFLGSVRDALPRHALTSVVFRDLELSQMQPSQLAQHPAVHSALVEE